MYVNHIEGVAINYVVGAGLHVVTTATTTGYQYSQGGALLVTTLLTGGLCV